CQQLRAQVQHISSSLFRLTWASFPQVQVHRFRSDDRRSSYIGIDDLTIILNDVQPACTKFKSQRLQSTFSSSTTFASDEVSTSIPNSMFFHPIRMRLDMYPSNRTTIALTILNQS